MAVKRLFIIAGDHSGDIHGANVVRALQRLDSSMHIAAVGGEEIRSTGAYLLADQSAMGRVGFGAITGAPYHYFLGRKILKFLQEFKPDGVLLIDYGGFNLWMAGQLKKRGYKVYYFIPPQVWASRKGRIKKIKETCRRVFCIFPFEEPLYQEAGVPVTFVGHPLAGQLPPPVSRESFCAQNGLDPGRKIIAVLPGSRKSEIGFMLRPVLASLPRLARAYRQANTDEALPQFVIARAGSLSHEYLTSCLDQERRALGTLAESGGVSVLDKQTHSLLSVADAAIVKSGTSTLEAALYHTPMVIIYKVHNFVYRIGRKLCYLPVMGLPNILTDMTRPPVPELLQEDLTSENIANTLLPLLDEDSSQRQKQMKAFHSIQQTLGAYQAAEKVAAELIREL